MCKRQIKAIRKLQVERNLEAYRLKGQEDEALCECEGRQSVSGVQSLNNDFLFKTLKRPSVLGLFLSGGTNEHWTPLRGGHYLDWFPVNSNVGSEQSSPALLLT